MLKKSFENSNGVSLNKEEYDFLTEMFYDGYQEILNTDDYINIFNEERDINTINKKVISNNILPMSSSVDNSDKKLVVSSQCANTCLITILVEWKIIPSVKSYDLIGANMGTSNLIIPPVTTISTTSGNSRITNYDGQTNGFGVSVKLPTSGSNYKITQYFTIAKGRTIYCSYQHAKEMTTLANSKKYTIDKSGLGKVFLFSNYTLKSIYDNMAGVSITV